MKHRKFFFALSVLLIVAMTATTTMSMLPNSVGAVSSTPTPKPTSTPYITPSGCPTPTQIPTTTHPTETPTPPPVVSFTDIEGHWGVAYINALAARGVISGYETSPGVFDFKPNSAMKRQEFAKIITVAYGIYNSSATSIFSDCPVDKWFTPYVGSLEAEGLTSGMDDGTYGVDRNMSRQDAASMLARTMVKYQSVTLPDAGEAATVVAKFADVAQISSYAKPPIAFFVNAKIINGFEAPIGSGIFYFNPRANITRAEISKIMSLALDYVAPTPTPTLTPTPTPTPTPP